MRNSKVLSIAAAVILGLDLLAVSAWGVAAAQRGGGDACVAVSGGTVSNVTNLDVVADGGTGISDASGGSGNVAARSGNDNRDNGRRNNNNNRRNNRNRNNWAAEPVAMLEARLLQTDTASAGNGGVATTSANGGAVSIGDINSGGNAGNAISVGDTVCPGAAGGGHAGGGRSIGGGGRGGNIRALPSTGIGLADAGASESLYFALGAVGLGMLSLGLRRHHRVWWLESR